MNSLWTCSIRLICLKYHSSKHWHIYVGHNRNKILVVKLLEVVIELQSEAVTTQVLTVNFINHPAVSSPPGRSAIVVHYVTLRYTTLHYVTLRYTTLHYVTPRYTTLHHVTPRYTTPHHTTPHHTTPHHTTPHHTTPHHTTPHHTTPHHTTFHSVSSVLLSRTPYSTFLMQRPLLYGSISLSFATNYSLQCGCSSLSSVNCG